MGPVMKRRGSGLRTPFVCVLVLLTVGLCWRYAYYDSFVTFGRYVIPTTTMTTVMQLQCNRTTTAVIDASAAGTNQDPRLSPSAVHGPNSDLSRADHEPCNCACKDAACPPAQVVVEEKVVEKEVVKVVQVEPNFEQWHAKKPWHTPGTFPLCTMDACFNFTRCENQDEFLVYHYNVPTSPERYLQSLNTTSWYTPDPEKACLFFVFQDTLGPWTTHPEKLPYWNNGMNHVLITWVDLWHLKNPPPNEIRNASVLSSALLETTYRPGFDIGIPLQVKNRYDHLQGLKPLERKYLLTFRGTRYLERGGVSEGTFRSHQELRAMHNGKDVIVVTSCKHHINDMMREETPEVGVGCDEDQKLYDQYEYKDLFNSTFSLAPAGRSGSSYRFLEGLSAGSIPVLIADNHVKPFENLIQWHRCILQFPTNEMPRIIPALRKMDRDEIEERQRYCIWVFNEFLKDDETLLQAVMRALKARFYGVLGNYLETSRIYKGINR